ncbi:MAG: flagellar basal-body rod modification protein FlgD [Candidatus Azotimanducaceae bacterium]|jgi:flagellar basal-body rod modification protein FlgD
MNEISQVSSPLLAELKNRVEPEGEELDKNAFLKLMVAQMNNQDPLSPQDNGEFVAQLAQFSSVEGIENMNKTMSQMANSMQSSQALQASGLVGRTVHINTDTSILSEGGVISGNVNLENSTSNLMINIMNSSGELVRQVEMGSQTRGDVRFAWNGQNAEGVQLPPGSYKFTAEASVGGATEQMSLALSANVNSVTINPDRSVVLNVAGQGAVPLLEVAEIL